ncbi:MAG: hypothetical protein AAGG48_14605 [Planctomycetota bacterium]
MAGPKVKEKWASWWPESATNLRPWQLVDAYNKGLAGAYHEPEEKEAFEDDIRQQGGFVFGEDAATASGWAESGAGQLILPFVWVILHFGKCWPASGQDRGDCVSHDQRNANLLSYACEIQDGKPDQESGKPEQVPKMPSRGMADGAFSTEVYYWFRRHGRDGWSCDAAARVAMREGGLVTRDDHTETLGVDLTRYSGRNAGKYGRTPPSGSVADALDNNLVRTATTLKSKEERRDFLANGYGLSTCGSQGYSNKRDQWGVSRRRGRWAHAMAFIGFDDRPSTVEQYGDTLELVLNSWAIWNSGSRQIRDSAGYVKGLIPVITKTFGLTDAQARQKLIDLDLLDPQTGNLLIPHGSFWARSRDVSGRRVIAKSSVNGWPKRDLFIPLGSEGNV